MLLKRRLMHLLVNVISPLNRFRPWSQCDRFPSHVHMYLNAHLRWPADWLLNIPTQIENAHKHLRAWEELPQLKKSILACYADPSLLYSPLFTKLTELLKRWIVAVLRRHNVTDWTNVWSTVPLPWSVCIQSSRRSGILWNVRTSFTLILRLKFRHIHVVHLPTPNRIPFAMESMRAMFIIIVAVATATVVIVVATAIVIHG